MKLKELNVQKIMKPHTDNLIYFLLDDGEVVYVGQTTKSLCRPFQHTDKNFDSVAIIECELSELDMLEDKYIKKYNPKYNNVLNHAMNLSFKKARDEIKNLYPELKFTLPKLKKLIRKLNIRPIVLNDISYITQEDMICIKKEIERSRYDKK